MLKEHYARAKDRKSGEWVCGFYAKLKQISYIIQLDEADMRFISVYGHTVDRCTGLYNPAQKTDIFDRDILQVIEVSGTTLTKKCVVLWHDGGWWVRYTDGTMHILAAVVHRATVIGNYTDNPELLWKEEKL